MTTWTFLILQVLLSIRYTEGDSIPVLWPSGRYGLPRPQSGCPRTSGFNWATGTRFQVMNPDSKKSELLHLNASVTKQGVEQSYCIKNSTIGDATRPAWPAGKYCIYRKGKACPKGLTSGYFFWDDLYNSPTDRIRNSMSGTLPSGLYDGNTMIYFCCSTKGTTTTPISLPLDSPFYLMAYGSPSCQKVKGALYNSEFIKYDTDANNFNAKPTAYFRVAKNPKFYYCYYRACQYESSSLYGTITSPYYPSNYPTNVDCQWTIKPPALPNGYQFLLVFSNFTLDSSTTACTTRCTCDWIRVSGGVTRDRSDVLRDRSGVLRDGSGMLRDGSGVLRDGSGMLRDGRVTQTFCEGPHAPPFTYHISGYDVITIDFHSDSTGTAQGFNILYAVFPIAINASTTVNTTTPTTTHNNTTTPTNTHNNTTTPTNTHNNTTNTTTTEQWISMTTESRTGATTEPDEVTPTRAVYRTTGYSSANATRAVGKAKRNQEGEMEDWLIAVVVVLVLVAAAGIIGILYCRRRKKTIEALRVRLTVRYNQNAYNDVIMCQPSTIDMYSGDPIEPDEIPETDDNPFYGTITKRPRNNSKNSSAEYQQERDNPLYEGTINRACDNEDTVLQSAVDLHESEDNKESGNPLYGEGNETETRDSILLTGNASVMPVISNLSPIYSSLDDKDYVTLYESLPDGANKQSENPLYESLT